MSSLFFSPKLLDNSEFEPTAAPIAKLIIKFCIGNAIETAVNAFSSIIDTNFESTILYKACISIEIIIGIDIFKTSSGTG
ncbi:Uncharacterised protein [Chlamydia trachomatis]|nr:Uncharacterised protein [Chlamydia trachomatis]